MKRILWLALVGLSAGAPLFAEEPKLLATLTGHTDEVRTVAFSPDGKTLAVGTPEKTIKLLDVGTLKGADK